MGVLFMFYIVPCLPKIANVFIHIRFSLDTRKPSNRVTVREGAKERRETRFLFTAVDGDCLDRRSRTADHSRGRDRVRVRSGAPRCAIRSPAAGCRALASCRSSGCSRGHPGLSERVRRTFPRRCGRPCSYRSGTNRFPALPSGFDRYPSYSSNGYAPTSGRADCRAPSVASLRCRLPAGTRSA